MKDAPTFFQKKTLATGVALALGVSIAVPAWSAGKALEEIIVTAQKREENVLEVPVAITVVGADQLADQRIYDLADLARTTPSLEMIQAFGGPGGGGQVRGVGTQSFTRSAEGAVGVIVDGVPQGNVPMNAVFDLERVEVLKGPQGTLFGLTASAGVINMTTVAPDPTEFKGYIQADYSPTDSAGSEFGQKTMRGALNFPLTDNAALRVVANFDRVEGVQYDAATGEDNVAKEKSLRARYLWNVSDKITLNLIGDYSKRDRDFSDPTFTYVEVDQSNPLFQQLADCGITPSYDNNGRCISLLNESEFQNHGFSAQIDFEFEPGTMTMITGYRKQKEGPSSFDIMANPQDHDQIYNRNAFTEGKQLSQEIRFSSNTGDAVEYTSGVYYYKYERESGYSGEDGGFYVGIPSLPPFLPFCMFNDILPGVCHVASDNAGNETENEAWAVFGQAKFRIDDNWSVIAGLRYTSQDLKDTYLGNSAEGAAVPDTFKEDETNVSGKIGLQYQMDSGTMLFATFTRGYKGPQVQSATEGDPRVVIDAEIPEAWEIGAKGVLGEGVGYEATVFYNDVQDFQGQRCRINGLGILSCVGESIPSVESKGVELNFFGNVTDNLHLNAGYIYNTVEYPSGWTGFNPDDLRDPVPGTMIGLTSLSGEQLVGVPEHKFVLNADYTIPLDGLNLVIGGDAVYKSDIRLGPSGDDRFVYDADWTVSARVGLEEASGVWSVQLFARNITENREPATLFGGPSYVSTLDDPTGYVNGISGWTTKASLTQVGLTARYNF